MYLKRPLIKDWASPMAQTVKNLSAMRETWVQSLGWKIPWRRAWQPTSVISPGESPWTGYSPWGCKESDMTEQISTALRID